MTSYFTAEQIDALLRPIRAHRVSKDGKGFSHVEAYDIRAHLNRLLGFGRWSADLTDLALVFETEADKKWTTAYRATVRLTVCAPDGTVLATYTEAAVGDAKNQPSRSDAADLAIKTAESQAFKRCAANLGSQFGLSLYNKGSLEEIVRATLIHPDSDGEEKKDVQDDVPAVEPESTQADPVVPPSTAGPAVSEEPPNHDHAVEAIRAKALAATRISEISVLLAQASKAKLLQEKTADSDGAVCTVKDLIQAQSHRLTVRAS